MSDTGEQLVARKRLYSKLYCRVNGFMLGVFIAMCQLELARKRYPFCRRRIMIFLEEIGARIDVPKAYGQDDQWALLAEPIPVALGQRSAALRDSYLLGLFAVSYVFFAKRNRPEAERNRRKAREILRRLRMPFSQFDAMVRAEGKPAKSVHDLLSPVLQMLTELLRPLRPEPKTCFVAMPFRAPFEGYYVDYYRPVLLGGGYRPLRAWGGFGDEDFSPLLVALILKSGAFLGDITSSNPNVLWEVGVAQGAGKPVFLVHDANDSAPSDLAKNVALPYQHTDEKNWPADVVERDATILALLSAAVERVEGDAIRVASGLRDNDIETTRKWLTDTFWELSFATTRSNGGNDANDHIQRGLERNKDKRWLDAESDFGYAIRHGGHLPSAHYGRGIARMELRRYRDAERDFGVVLRAGVDDSMLRYFRGLARLNLRRYRLACEDFDASIEQGFDDASPFQARAIANSYLGNIARCADDCRDARKRAPQHAQTHGAFGYLHLARGEFSRAALHFRRARGVSFGKAWHFEAAVAQVLAGRDAANEDIEQGLLHASDSDIDEALRELTYWNRRLPAKRTRRERARLVKQMRHRLLEVRTPRAWGH